MATSIVPAIYDPHLADRQIGGGNRSRIRNGEAACPRGGPAGGHFSRGSRCRLLADRPRRVCKRTRAVIVTVLPDSADKYLSERFWEEQ